MSEDLNPIDDVPTQTVAVVKVIDHSEGDEGVIAEPGIADHEPREYGDDRSEEDPGLISLPRGGVVIHGSQW